MTGRAYTFLQLLIWVLFFAVSYKLDSEWWPEHNRRKAEWLASEAGTAAQCKSDWYRMSADMYAALRFGSVEGFACAKLGDGAAYFESAGYGWDPTAIAVCVTHVEKIEKIFGRKPACQSIL